MNVAAKQLYDSALELPECERADLAARLIESLDDQVDEDLDAAWEAELGRRIEELDSGQVTAVPWPEARRMIMGLPDAPSAD